MFSEEQNGKNPEKMETEQSCETVEQAETEIAAPETDVPATEELTEPEEITAEEQPTEEQPREEQPTEEQPTEEQPTEEQPAEEQPAERECSTCGIKEKWAVLVEKLRNLIPAKKQTEETMVEETTEETAENEIAVEENCDNSQETETAEEEASAAQETTRKRPADAFLLEETVTAEDETSPVEEKTVVKPADAFSLEETAGETETSNDEVEEMHQAQEALFADEEEAAPAPKKIKPLHLGLAIAGGVILLGVLVFLILHALGIDLKPRANDLLYKDVYTVEEQQLEKKADDVVATLGDEELTVSELQLYYIDSIYAFYSQNYYYLEFMGLDLSAPLSEQECSLDQSLTWEQYFLDAAIKSWQSYVLVDLMAQQDGFAVSPEVQTQIDSMGDQLESIAVSYGYENASAYLSAEMAPGVSVETYLSYNEVFHVSYEYLNTFYEEDYPSEIQIRNFYEANKATFQENGITPDMGLISNVRHILIQPMGGTLSEDGLETVYSDEEWATALSEAERILEAWKAGDATEDSFATMANTYSEDGGSNTTGGLYEAIDPFSSYVPEFLNWAIDSSRQVGDTDIVKTTYGYHIMYFVSGQDYFNYVVGEQLITDRIQTRLAGLKDEYPIDVNYKKVVLCEPVM